MTLTLANISLKKAKCQCTARRVHRQTLYQRCPHRLAGITGEQISGDLLSATLWSWFAAAESHNRLSQNQASMVEIPALSYGLFHAIAQPVTSWGVIRKVEFPGVNMDIGHVRNTTWSKDNNTKAWIANRSDEGLMGIGSNQISDLFLKSMIFEGTKL